MTYRGSAIEHVLDFKCHRKYYNGSDTENTDLHIFCDTCLQCTAKPTERQKRLTILADSLAKHPVSQQCKFLWKSADLHRPGSTGQCRLTALVANAIFIRLDK